MRSHLLRTEFKDMWTPDTLSSMVISSTQMSVVLLMHLHHLLEKECLARIQGISMKEKDLHMSHLDLLQQISLLLDYPMLCLATTGMIIPL